MTSTRGVYNCNKRSENMSGYQMLPVPNGSYVAVLEGQTSMTQFGADKCHIIDGPFPQPPEIAGFASGEDCGSARSPRAEIPRD